MIKVTLIFASVVALCAATVLYTDVTEFTDVTEVTDVTDVPDVTDDPNSMECLYTNEMWGGVDGTKFYFCLPGTNTAIEQSCPTNKFFVKNSTTTGCVQYEDLSPNCVYTQEVQPCEGIYLLQPQPSVDVTMFYLCKRPLESPVLLSCADGKAFVSQDGYVGCFDWAKWREVRNCYD